MRISVAQIRSAKGDVPFNIASHKKLIDAAVAGGAQLIIFPELSLTGYEPTLAKELAVEVNDSRFDIFQQISDLRNISIGAGIPTKDKGGICISMLLFQPGKPRRVYSKKYIHPDEEPFFVSGQNFPVLEFEIKIGLAICYEISVEDHLREALDCSASIYLASVAKFTGGIDKALMRLSDISEKHSMQVLMANCIGEADGCHCAGRSSYWNTQGELIAQLDDTSEGVLIVDTETQTATVITQ